MGREKGMKMTVKPSPKKKSTYLDVKSTASSFSVRPSRYPIHYAYKEAAHGTSYKEAGRSGKVSAVAEKPVRKYLTVISYHR